MKIEEAIEIAKNLIVIHKDNISNPLTNGDPTGKLREQVDALSTLIKFAEEVQAKIASLEKIISYETAEVMEARAKGLVSPQEYRDAIIKSQQAKIAEYKETFKKYGGQEVFREIKQLQAKIVKLEKENKKMAIMLEPISNIEKDSMLDGR